MLAWKSIVDYPIFHHLIQFALIVMRVYMFGNNIHYKPIFNVYLEFWLGSWFQTQMLINAGTLCLWNI